ncbi:MAG TPA: hypothetical protein VFC00_23225 [Micromonosporaceae bacterium]|nr:hypothetical protein [Micromonosporaceae bacterium]
MTNRDCGQTPLPPVGPAVGLALAVGALSSPGAAFAATAGLPVAAGDGQVRYAATTRS